jgi:hypothetical protein
VCPHREAFGRTSTQFNFTTRNFTVAAGVHLVTFTWDMRYLVDLHATGGRVGHPLPASALAEIGLNGARLCDLSNRTCLTFPNSSAPGSGASVGWLKNYSVANGSLVGFHSYTVTIFLNATFAPHHHYRISSSVFAYAEAKAASGSYTAQAYLVVTPIFGDLRLASITVS